MGFNAMFLAAAAAGLAASTGALPSAPHDRLHVDLETVVEDPAEGVAETQLVPEGYRDLANITAIMREWSLLFPERAALYDITDEYNNGRKTAEGRGV